MMESGYTLAWLVYLGGALVAYASGWWVSRGWPVWLSYPLRALTLALILTPWTVTDEGTAMGPAWVITAFDTFVLANGDPLRAGAPLVAASGLAFVVAIVACVWHYSRRSRAL